MSAIDWRHTGGGLMLALALVLAVIVSPAKAQTFTVVYSFTGVPDGYFPVAFLIQDSAGNLYGTTELGGNPNCFSGNGCGVVFKLDPTGKETVLYRFTGSTDGNFPTARLLRDKAGNLYGTAQGGGRHGFGVAFKLDPTGKETVLHSFGSLGDGVNPSAGLIRDKAGTCTAPPNRPALSALERCSS